MACCGNQLQVLDLLVQQFKATTMAIRDGGWGAARHLQLLPESSGASTVSASDEALARKMEMSDLILNELKKKASETPR